MKNLDRRRACFALLLPLAGCASWLAPRTFVISQDDLQARLARNFPIDRRVLSVLDVQVQAPTIRLLPDEGRLAMQAAVGVDERLRGGRYDGRLDFDSGLKLEPETAVIRLERVRVSRFELRSAASGGLNGTLREAGAVLAEQVLEGYAVWSPKPEQLEKLASAGLQARSVAITARGVEIDLAPAP